MLIFHSYVKLPEGTTETPFKPERSFQPGRKDLADLATQKYRRSPSDPNFRSAQLALVLLQLPCHMWHCTKAQW